LTLFYLGVFITSVVSSFILTRYVRNAAVARGWVSAPGNERHLHCTPLPRLGGVAIFLAFFIALTLALMVCYVSALINIGAHMKPLLTILCSASLIFLLGMYDDLRSASPQLKFAVQGIAAGMLFAGGLRISDLPVLFGGHQFSWFIGLPLTIFWVIGITNAFNLIDGLDGLAAGSALFSTLVVFVVAISSQYAVVSLMALSLAGAVLGFLRFNFNPATIFLGDSGSLFIGFMLSALALMGAQKAPTVIAVAIPVVSFGLPILETAISVLRRFISGRPVFTADREHIHHKLLQLGFSHRQVVIVLYAVSAVFALLSLFLLWPTGSTLGLVLAVLGAGVWIGVQHLNYLEFGELRRVAQRTISQRQIFINNMAVRRAAEELKVAVSGHQIIQILEAAFTGNDFDAFQLNSKVNGVSLAPSAMHAISGDSTYIWTRPGVRIAHDLVSAWSLRLDLVAANNRRCGSLLIYRTYSTRDLQLDINLLTSVFPVALADALQRISCENAHVFVPIETSAFAAAQAG
jgi:UDP-GlcNAc:undecaprenyl-phosphate/decaprenyl-phosphate GlcNAc-1-phosphate transferase